MSSLSLLAFSSFLAAFLLTPVVRNLALRRGWVDRPDHRRRVHTHPVPRLGGLAIFLSYLAALAVLLLSPLAAGDIVHAGLPLAGRIFPAAALVFAVGLLDDLRGLKPWHKFAAQSTAAYIAFWAGVQITGVAGLSVPPWLALPLTLFWLVGCSNAFNLIDGVDGLAAGAGFFATVTILLGALLHGNTALALATVPLAGALLGFLRYNFNPASIFLGDCGSLTLGFLLGCYGVLWGQKSAAALGMTAPLLALAIPLLDTAVAIARRILRGRRIFEADRGHIHHRLLDRGLTPRRVALLLYAACGAAAALSLLASVAQDQFRGAIIVLFCVAAWIGVQHLGYVEFGVVGRMFFGGALGRHIRSHLALRAFQDSLAAASTPEDCWEVIRGGCRDLGFTQVRFRLNGRTWAETLCETNGEPTWRMEIPLAEGDYVSLSRPFHSQVQPTVLAPFADALRSALCSKPRPAAPLARAAHV